MYIGMGVMGLCNPARSMTVHDNQFCSNTESDQVDLSHCKVLIYSAATLDSKLFMNVLNAGKPIPYRKKFTLSVFKLVFRVGKYTK